MQSAVLVALIACSVPVSLLSALFISESKRKAKALDFTKLAAQKVDSISHNIDAYGVWVNNRWDGDPDPSRLQDRDHYIMGLGLPGETGEVCELLKKWKRDGKLDIKNLTKELGDIQYYIVRIATAHGIEPSEVLRVNIEKIEDRIQRGVLHGSGNDR